MGQGNRRQLFVIVKIVLPLLICLALAACSNKPIQRKDGTTPERPVKLSNIAKRDVDDASEIAQKEAIASLKRLAEKLYRRNPAEWRKGSSPTLEAAVASIFAPHEQWQLFPHSSLDWQASINNAFREDYAGDRVEALMRGLLTMTMAAYDHKTELFMLDELDPQKLYNAARNIEIAAWRLSNARNANGELLLLSNGVDPNGVANLSFEREFGKLVATQDLIALIIEDKTNRSIRFIVVNLASLAFLPI